MLFPEYPIMNSFLVSRHRLTGVSPFFHLFSGDAGPPASPHRRQRSRAAQAPVLRPTRDAGASRVGRHAAGAAEGGRWFPLVTPGKIPGDRLSRPARGLEKEPVKQEDGAPKRIRTSDLWLRRSRI